ncbi:MAG TPA: FAD-binding protein [Beggiatoa sp.]|nr:FAD-binding protein [Beggiatoa sp.]
MKIAVAKETRYNDKWVSLVPEIVERLIALETEVVVETGAGEGAGFSDEAYRTKGATIAHNKTHLYQGANIVSWLKRPENENDELLLMPSSALVVGFFDPFKPDNPLRRFAQKGVTTISLELLPHNKETKQMDAFSVMGKFAGRIAYLNALKTVTSTAQHALIVLIIGSGNAAMAAAKQAHQDGNRIIVVSTNDSYQSIVEEQLSGVFVLLANDSRPILAERRQQERLRQVILEHKPDIITTTARRYGQPAPKLITETELDIMKPGTVIEDLTASLGGNTVFTKLNQEVKLKNNIIIRNKSNYPCQEPTQASESYSHCLWALLEHVITRTRTEPNYNIANDPILNKAVVTHQGQLCFIPVNLKNTEKDV